MSRIFLLVLALLALSCGGIENEVRRAGSRCEARIDSKMAEFKEQVDDICLTKEEVLQLLRQLNRPDRPASHPEPSLPNGLPGR